MRTLWMLDYSAFEITELCQCSISAVYKWKNRFENNIEIVEFEDRRKHLPGREYKISDEQLELILERIENDPFLSAKKIPYLLNINIRAPALRNTLRKRANLFCYRAAKKTAINAIHRKARLDYAMQHAN